MIFINSLQQFDRAKLRASVGKLTVTTSTVWRVYRVTNEEKQVTYRVSFWRDRARAASGRLASARRAATSASTWARRSRRIWN